jgi:hypothetical protein
MRASGYVTGLHKLYDFADFCRIHGAQWIGRFGAMSFNMASTEAEKAMKALHEYLFNTVKCASRMTADQFGKVFPPNRIIAEAFDLGSMQGKLENVYAEMDREIAKLEKRCENYSDHIFAILMKARRLAELCKTPLLVDKAEDFIAEGKNVCIFLNFDDSVQGVYKRLLKSKCVTKDEIGFVIGGQNAKKRQQDIDDFNADKKRVMIVNIAAGGTGISLHDLTGKYPRASLISPSWSSYNLKQAFGRIARLNGQSACFQLIVYGSRTVEEQICRRVSAKLSNLSALNDGDLMEHVNLVEH